jgi:hypothetical protein
MVRKIFVVVISAACATVAAAQDFPLWEQILKHYSGKTDETPAPSMKMGHMQMSLKRNSSLDDEARAAQILAAANPVLIQDRDVNTALRDGYKPFFPTGRIGEEIHYTNYHRRRLEQPNARFGPQGSIHTEDECNAAHGLWIPVVLEWMTHVYPTEQQQWGGMHTDVEEGG